MKKDLTDAIVYHRQEALAMMHIVFGYVLDMYVAGDIRQEEGLVIERSTKMARGDAVYASTRALWPYGYAIPMYPTRGRSSFCKDSLAIVDLLTAVHIVTGVRLQKEGFALLRLNEDVFGEVARPFNVCGNIEGMPIIVSVEICTGTHQEQYGFFARVFIRRNHSATNGERGSS